MRILKYLFLTLLSLAALWALMGLFAKHEYHVERSIEIDAPKAIVYDQVRFFKNIPNWSPWLYLDPNVKTSVEGTDGEVGAVYRWEGNKKIGKGSQTIKAINPNRVDIDIQFGDFSAAPAYFVLEDNDGSTRVTWAMDMHVPFPWNAFAMLTDMNNGFVGKDFGNGLANLKKYCETLAPKKYRGYVVREADRPQTVYLMLRDTVDFKDIPQYFSGGIDSLMRMLDKTGSKMAGVPSGFFWNFDTLAMRTDMAVALPLDKAPKSSPAFKTFEMGGKALVIEYLGNFDSTMVAHYAMADYLKEKKLKAQAPFLEEYVTDPSKEPDTAKWLTRIVYFVQDSLGSR